MPSRRKNSSALVESAASVSLRHFAFIPLLLITFVLWVLYRSIFNFPVWFDETFGKAVFFGLPVLLYVSVAKSKSIVETFDVKKLNKGLLLGIALGGVFGFTGALIALLGGGKQVVAVDLFSANAFWYEFFLALMTGFWESLFFLSWIMTVILEKYRKWGILSQVLLTASIFVVFHLPNIILRFDGPTQILGQIFLLALFAVGQALLFYRWRNFYAVTITHAIWGMVLLIHVQ